MTFSQATVNPPNDWRYITNGPYISPGGSSGATLDAILADAGITSGTISISDTQTLNADTNRTVKAGLTIKVLQGGLIVVPTGRTFTLTGTIDAGPYQIFNCQGTGAVKILGPQPYVHTRWWGATGDGTTDDTANLQAALTCVGGVINYPCKLISSPQDNYKVETVTYAGASGTWSVLDFCNARLTQKTTNDVLVFSGAGGRVSLSNLTVYGAGSPGSYAGSGVKVTAGTNFYMRDCLIQAMDKTLDLGYVLYSNFENLVLQQCNNAISIIGNGAGNSANFNTFKNIRINTTYGTAITLSDYCGRTHLFDHISLEVCYGRLISLANTQNTVFRSIHQEGGGNDNVVTEQYLIDACSQIVFEDCNFGLDVAGTSITSFFKFTGSSYGIRFSRNYFYTSASATKKLYTTDGTVYGISFNGDRFASGGLCGDANPQAVYHDITTTTVSSVGFSLPISAVKKSASGLTNWAGVNYDMSSTLTLGASADGTASAYDDTDFVVGTRSWKITWGTGAAAAWARQQTCFTVPGSGTYYPVISAYVKTDSAQTLGLSNINGVGEKVPVPADGEWHFISAILPAITNPGANGAFFQVLNGTGAEGANVWVDKVALYYFATPQEVMNMIGRD
jgi:hypothetical protein